MTKLLSKVLRQVEELSEDRQDDVADVIQAMLSNDALRYELTEEQLREVDEAIVDTEAGNFASDKQIRDALYRRWA
jgi:hypothetical protein